jgi:hypothetical protein
MKTKSFLATLCLGLAGLTYIHGQGFKPPSEGKAVVYFARVTSYGFAISFEYFHGDKYIAIAKGKNYVRYECDPGKHLFWLSTENKEFLTADLLPGRTYIAVVNVAMGFAKARVSLTPITDADKDIFARVKELVKSEPPVVTSQEKIDEMNVRLKDFIAEKLKTYEEVWKKEKDFKHMSPEMAISEDALK